MNVKSKIKLVLLLTMIFFMALSVKVFAASISVSPSKSSVSPGESFTVSISSNGATGKVSISASNGSVSSSSLWLEPSGSITVTAGSSGSVGIYVTAVDMSDASGNEVSPSGSASVSIVSNTSSSGGSSSGTSSGGSSSSSSGSSSNKTTQTTKTQTQAVTPVEEVKSSDATLKSLEIVEGTMSPEFDTNVTEYTLTVPNEIKKLTINTEVNNDKAKYEIGETAGNLIIGENIINITVTAEDETIVKIYTITVIREKLELSTLKVSYKDENGEVKELILTPEFKADVLEYTLEDISYIIESIDVDAIANSEKAKVEIVGNTELKTGENIITITLTIPGQEEENIEDEVITYTLKVNKEEEPIPPTLMGRIKNWMNGIPGWYAENKYDITKIALISCSSILFILSIYFIVDYKKYKTMIAKIAELTNINNSNTVQNYILEQTNENNSIAQKEENGETVKTKTKGKRFI